MKEKKKNGFTLVELLATILIISIVLTIGSLVINKIITNSKDESTKLAIANIKSTAKIYVEEYQNEIIWQQAKNEDQTPDTNHKYSCVSINELVNKNLLKPTVLENYSSLKYIIVTKDNNNTIISEEFDNGTCQKKYTAKIPTNTYCQDNQVYDGTEKTLTTTSEEEKFKFKNYIQTNAGTYKVTAELKAPKYSWTDGSIENKTIYCKIKKASPILTLSSEGADFGEIGSEITTTLTSNVAGKISIKVSNKDYLEAKATDNYVEANGNELITIKFISSKKTSSYITITLTPDNDNYYTSTKTFKIEKQIQKEIEVPTAEKYCQNPTYNSKEQTLVKSITQLKNEGLNREGFQFINDKATEIGEHTVTVKLKYGYAWKGVATSEKLTPKTFNCSIKRPTPTITYNNNGGTGCTSKTVTYENTYGSLCTPKKAGYTFAGWYADNNLTTSITQDTKVTNFKNHTLYAKWQANTYTITYNANGGNGTMPNTTITYGISTTTRKNTFTKTGYTFVGWTMYRASDKKWYYKVGDSTAWYVEGSQPSGATKAVLKNEVSLSKSSTVNGDTITLYAKWQANTYTITYNANGGTSSTYGTSWSEKVSYGTKYTTRPNWYTPPTGYSFIGWNESANGSGTNWTNYINVPWTWTYTKNVTLYAQWKANTYTINYNANGGSGAPASQTKTHGINLTLASNRPTRTGYTFLGWSTSASATTKNYDAGATFTTNSNTTLYAVWSINKVNIKFNTNGGSITASTADSSGSYKWSTDSSGIISLSINGGTATSNLQTLNYGTSFNENGLLNWDNGTYMKISKNGYKGADGAEWKCLSGCTNPGSTYNDSKVYSASDFCDASSGDCTVVLGVNWVTSITYRYICRSQAPDRWVAGTQTIFDSPSWNAYQLSVATGMKVALLGSNGDFYHIQLIEGNYDFSNYPWLGDSLKYELKGYIKKECLSTYNPITANKGCAVSGCPY